MVEATVAGVTILGCGALSAGLDGTRISFWQAGQDVFFPWWDSSIRSVLPQFGHLKSYSAILFSFQKTGLFPVS
jgi:hypothetical protein